MPIPAYFCLDCPDLKGGQDDAKMHVEANPTHRTVLGVVMEDT